jgi:hypothetical protein
MATMASPVTMSNKFVPMLDQPVDLRSVVQKVRLSRLKLGSILERLESFERGPAALKELDNYAESLGLEIDVFVDALRKLTSSANTNQ